VNSIKLETKILIFNYILCISSYRLAKDAYQAIANLIPHGAISNRILLLVVMVYCTYLLMFLCGMAMGFLTKKRVVLHSLIAATASVALDIYFITNIASGDYIWVLSMLASGALLGGLGGVVALALKKLIPSYK
jgi:hypothetical protein